MTFNAFSYFIFLPVVYLAFCCTADRWRWLILLLASYGFYASFEAKYLLAVLLSVTAISYVCGLRIAAQQDESLRKRWLWFGSFTCVIILAVLKLLPFLETKVGSIFGLGSSGSATIISIGVSYFTFQAISYMADIYLEMLEPESHFGRFALYMAFFPKLLQGPIERAGDLLPQLRREYRFDYDAVRTGLFLFVWGLFKKVVIADRLASFVDEAFKNVNHISGLPLLITVYWFSLQIYFDFSGYTDMARGTARIFGINLTENFTSPYLATSIADFWRRWHISFSRWILDYIFKPLQMQWRSLGQTSTALALLVTFLISGVWHGVSWGFVVWGSLHGIYLATSTYYRPYQKKIYKWLGIEKSRWLKVWQAVVTFNLVSFAWIFFRMPTLSDAFSVIERIFTLQHGVFKAYSSMLRSYDVAIILFSLPLFVLFHIVGEKEIMDRFYEKPLLFRWPVYFVFVVTIVLFRIDASTNFIYFQF